MVVRRQRVNPNLVLTSPKSVYTRVEILYVTGVTDRLSTPPPSHSALISTITVYKVERANCVALKKFRVRNTCVVNRGSTVVKVLCYKSEGRWFDSRWCHWNFSLI